MSVIAKGILTITKEISKAVLIITFGILGVSCASTKTATNGSEECDMKVLVKNQRQTEKGVVKTLDNTVIIFESINQEILTSSNTYQQLFDEKMGGTEDSLTVAFKRLHEQNDKMKICTFNQANARWLGFQFRPEDATQERVKEMLNVNTKNNLNVVLQELFLASEYNFYLMRGEPISPQKEKFVKEVFIKYAPASLKGKSFQEVRDAFIKDFGLPIKAIYTGPEAVDFRSKWPGRVARNELRARMLESRLQKNR